MMTTPIRRDIRTVGPKLDRGGPVALVVRLDPGLVSAVAQQLAGTMSVASVPHVAAACDAMLKHKVGVVLASSSLPFWDRHVLVERTAASDVRLCFLPPDVDAADVMETLGKNPPRQGWPKMASRL